MKLKYKSCIKSFILFILFNILSMVTFAIATNSKSTQENKISTTFIKTRQAVNENEVSPFETLLDKERGYLIQDGAGIMKINQISLSENGGTLSSVDLGLTGAINAFGYNPKDDYIYGINRLNFKNYLIKLGRDKNNINNFAYSSSELTKLTSEAYIADFDKNGNMFV